MSLFRLDSSIRTEGSVSREVTDTVEQTWAAAHPGELVVRRDLVRGPLPADLWTTSLGAGMTPEAERTPEQRKALDLVRELADEVVAADALVIGSPLYNFGIAAHLKSWADVLITEPRFAPGTQPLAGKPVALVVSRGGGYGPGTPREGWDHGTGWLIRILGDVWGGDVTCIEAELTLADTVPAMAELRPLAAQVRAQAHENAGAWLVAS
jgi:FMN-dependent NADH-azoreductase